MSQSQTPMQSNWIGHTIAGRYQIEAILGRGGMSTVYRATDPNLKRTVAIKLIHPHLSSDPEFVRRFEQEAAAVAQLRHPNIIQVYDFDHDGEFYYMVMEYVPGQTLQSQLKRLNAANRRLAASEIARIMATVSEAVAYAHERNMIHRDLKPGNIMINAKGEPILMDFGVAKMLDSVEQTATGAVIGTAKYMSPEQARGSRPDERSDIYSLGIMLYEMATGQPPYGGESSAISLMMKHVSEPLPDIRIMGTNVPEGLIQIIEKSLAKSPDLRYQQASELAIALRYFNNSMAQQAPSPAATPVPVADATLMDELTSITPPPAFSDQSSPTPTPTPTPPPPQPQFQPSPSLQQPRPQQPQPQMRPQPQAQPSKSSGFPLWLIGAGVAVLLLLVLGFVAYQLLGGSTAEDGTAVALNEEEALPSSRRMVSIAAGSYSVGVDNADSEHAPKQTVELAAYWIDQYEVTNAEYAQFLAATDGQPAPTSWSGGTIPDGHQNYPAQGVTWDMASAYCQWANKRLPTEAEWEVAARGPQGTLFPWGDDERAVDLPRSGTYHGGSVAQNRSPFGAFDMAGNLWEWVDEPYAPIAEGNRLLRGGAYGFVQDMAYRLQGNPAVPTMSATSGFRCAADKVKNDGPQVAEGGNVLLSDDFTDPNSGWPVLADEENSGSLFGYHPPDFYHVEVSLPEGVEWVSYGPSFDKVTVESNIFVAKTDTEAGDFRYGLILNRSGDDFYAFTISNRTKTWYVLKSSGGNLEELAQGTEQSIQGLAKDSADKFRVDADGGNFVFWLNDKPVTQINDGDYVNGEVGFFVETFDEGLAHIHYDTLTIRQIEGEGVPLSVGGVLAEDDFTDPGTGWPVLAGDEESTSLFGYHPPDFYHVEVSAEEVSEVVSKGPAFADVTVESKLFVAKTDSDSGDFRYGLVLRRTDENFYAFTISSRTDSWYVLKSSADGLEVLDEGSEDLIKGDSQANLDTLRVDAEGDEFIFYIDGRPVSIFSDADYPEGEVGFFVENFDEPLAHVHFDTLKISKVGSN